MPTTPRYFLRVTRLLSTNSKGTFQSTDYLIRESRVGVDPVQGIAAIMIIVVVLMVGGFAFHSPQKEGKPGTLCYWHKPEKPSDPE
jgi:hypothetical protein